MGVFWEKGRRNSLEVPRRSMEDPSPIFTGRRSVRESRYHLSGPIPGRHSFSQTRKIPEITSRENGMQDTMLMAGCHQSCTVGKRTSLPVTPAQHGTLLHFILESVRAPRLCGQLVLGGGREWDMAQTCCTELWDERAGLGSEWRPGLPGVTPTSRGTEPGGRQSCSSER